MRSKKKNKIMFIILAIIVIIITVQGCSEKSTGPKDPESGSPLITKSGEAWEEVLDDDAEDPPGYLIFKASGIMEIYTKTKLFGWIKEGEVIFRTSGNSIFVTTPIGEEIESRFTIEDNGQTLYIGSFDEDEEEYYYTKYTKQQVSITNALEYPNLYNTDIFVDISEWGLYMLSYQGLFDSVELKIDGNQVEITTDGYDEEYANYYADFQFNEGVNYNISILAKLGNKTYQGAVNITIVDRIQDMNITKSSAVNWWDFPVIISWELPHNSMLVVAQFDANWYYESGFIDPSLRSITIPAGTMNEDTRYFSFEIQCDNYAQNGDITVASWSGKRVYSNSSWITSSKNIGRGDFLPWKMNKK